MMTCLRGHFDGHHVVLDEPAPPDLAPNTPVEILVTLTREQALREWEASVKKLWERPLPPGFKPTGQRRWKREDLYERGGKPLS